MNLERSVRLARYDLDLFRKAPIGNDLVSENRDFADALKLEVSLPSAEQESIKNASEKVNSVIRKRFSRFFGLPAQKFSEGNQNRVVSFEDTDAFYEYVRLLGGNDEVHIKRAEAIRTPIEKGYLTAFPIASVFPNSDYAEDWVTNLVEKEGISKSLAEEKFTFAYFFHILTHETLHIYEFPSVYGPFSECAVAYYSEKVLSDLKIPLTFGRLDENRNYFYKLLLNKYGDDLHKFYFGSLGNFIKQTSILSNFNKKILGELFPNGYGLSKKQIREFKE